MFKTIFLYELKYWLRQPATYIYGAILFAIAFVTMTGMASEPPNRFNGRIVNAPILLFDMTKKMMLLAFFLMPAVVGVAAYRDFNTNMHTLLYAYPFEKKDYLLAKFLSAFGIFTGIAFLLGLGYILGAGMPWTNAELLQPFNIVAYLQVFGLFLLPNLLFFSVVVFGVVLLSRNIYAGFIVVLLLLLISQITGRFFAGEATAFWAILFDPMGTKAIEHITDKWTVVEQNELLLPISNLFIYNRLLWLGIAGLLFVGLYRSFQFHQTATVFSFRKKADEPSLSPNFGSITKVSLPTVQYDRTFRQQLTTLWKGSMMDFRYIITSKAFLCLVLGGLVFVLLMMASVNPRWETETLPMTWQILELPSQFYSGIINLITFLYAGFLVHRARSANMNQLVDISPIPNWVLLGGKLLALVKMQMILLGLVMIGGMISQAYKGFYDFEIDQYLFNLYGLNLIHFVIWAMLALFIQTLFNNPYLGFFLLLLLPIGFIGVAEFGPQFLGLDFLEQDQFRYNQAPGGVFGLRYSDMDGYGPLLPPYFMYKLYWTLAGILLLGGALLLWTRGLPQSFKERLVIAKQRFHGQLAIGLMTVLVAFLSLGGVLYYENNIHQTAYTRGDRQAALAAAERKYKDYQYFNQPKIVDIKVNMDLFPNTRQFKANGEYLVINKSDQAIDTLLLNYLPDLATTYAFNRPLKSSSKDTIADLGHFDIVVLEKPLLAGDSLQMTFENHNASTTLLRTNTYVKSHGTFIEDDIFPRFGNWLSFIKSSNNMGHDNHKPHPTESHKLVHSYMAKDADLINFEATVSTDTSQVAFSPGHLEKEWRQKDRHYFQYKTARPIGSSYLFMSGAYAVVKDKWKDVDLAIYYDQKHPYNIDRMMRGLKAGLAYCSENFSPYQFNHLRMIEFSQTGGASAHGFPGVIPAGEGIGFIADVDDSEEGGTDYAFGTAVHEVAHQWWGHQVLPADALGSKMVVESLAEYVNVMVKKHDRGIQKMRNYQKGNLRAYLQGRNRDRLEEQPLMYAYPTQNYIHYPKGALVFYALSEYIGEQKLNAAIKKYVKKVAFQEGTYTTSIEMVDSIRTAVPDSLQYLITDLFETITLYDNQVVDWTSTPLENGQYRVDIELLVSKYRSGRQGRRVFSEAALDSLSYQADANAAAVYSLPLADYIAVGVFGTNDKELYLEKHLFNKIDNKVSIMVDELPLSVGIDPYGVLIDGEIGDNISVELMSYE